MKYNQDWEVSIIKCPNRMGFEMAIYRFDPMGKVFVLENFEHEIEVPEDHVFKRTYIPAPVMEALTEAINPKSNQDKGKYIEGELEASKKHLEDMRKLVFKKNERL